jgi:hypothetical protein
MAAMAGASDGSASRIRMEGVEMAVLDMISERIDVDGLTVRCMISVWQLPAPTSRGVHAYASLKLGRGWFEGG